MKELIRALKSKISQTLRGRSIWFLQVLFIVWLPQSVSKFVMEPHYYRFLTSLLYFFYSSIVECLSFKNFSTKAASPKFFTIRFYGGGREVMETSDIKKS